MHSHFGIFNQNDDNGMKNKKKTERKLLTIVKQMGHEYELTTHCAVCCVCLFARADLYMPNQSKLNSYYSLIVNKSITVECVMVFTLYSMLLIFLIYKINMWQIVRKETFLMQTHIITMHTAKKKGFSFWHFQFSSIDLLGWLFIFHLKFDYFCLIFFFIMVGILSLRI